MSAVDDYLAGCTPADRALLQQVREVVHRVVPDVVEVRSYGLPAFAVETPAGRRVVGGFAAGRRFWSWYPFSGATLDAVADRLGGRERTKGSLHFGRDEPVDEALLELLLTTRQAQATAEGR